LQYGEEPLWVTRRFPTKGPMLHTRELQLGLVPGAEGWQAADPAVGDGPSDSTSWLFRMSQYCGSLGPGFHVSEHAAIDLDRSALAVQDPGCDQLTN
jgi:hypothetical protein